MKKIFLMLSILLSLTTLNAIETLQMSEVGSTKSVSSSCVNTTCTVTLNAGSQLYFQIKNTSSSNLVLTKFEIIKTYNGQDVIESSTTDSSLLGGSTFDSNETVSLGYNLVFSTTATYWTGKYYIKDLDTGEKFINTLKWDNNLTTNSVVAADITENIINVSTVTEFRAALVTAASDNKDTIIYLADGTYTTTEDGLGQFQYSTSQEHTLTIKGSSRDNVILSGEHTNRVLYLSGGTEFNLENLTVQNGFINSGDGGGIWTNRNINIQSLNVNNNTNSVSFHEGGGIFVNSVNTQNYTFNTLNIFNSILENNQADTAGGFYCYKVIMKNSILRNNQAYKGGAGFISDYAQIYNSIIDSNINSGDVNYYKGGAFSSVQSFSLVNSLIINNTKGIYSYSTSKDSYIVNSIFTSNSDYDILGSGGSFLIENSYLDGNLNDTYFDTNLITSGTLGFVDEANGDYRLTADSVLLDAGTIDSQAVDIPTIDMDGNIRIAGSSIDIGPYEYSTTKPALYTFNYTGNATEFSELTFNITYNLTADRTLSSIEYDYSNDGSWTTINTHTFNTSGTYTVRVKVTDSQGEYSIRTLSVTITELAFADMTDEQKLVKAIDPTYYTQIMSIIQSKESTATTTGISTGESNVTSNLSTYGLITQTQSDTLVSLAQTAYYNDGLIAGKKYVQDNLTEFNLVTKTDKDTAVTTATNSGITIGQTNVTSNPSTFGLITIADKETAVSNALENGKQSVLLNPSLYGLELKEPLTKTSIDSLKSGWHNISNPAEITDLTIFDSATIVWIFSNTSNSWEAYSSNPTYKTKIKNSSDIKLAEKIDSNVGIWVLK